VEFPEEAWENISSDAKDLLQKLLVTDPSKRITCQEAMASPWMRRRDTMLRKNSLMFTSQRLKTFNARMKLKSAMIAVSAVTSARMSLRRSNNSLILKEVEEGTARQPSFMRLPLETDESSKEVDDSNEVDDKDQLSVEEA
jgi:serine/threonine protein kinase